MKNELKGLGKIFAFTFERQVKSTGYLVGTIVFALLCFLLPAGIMAAVEYFGGDSDSAVETAAVSPVQTVYVADETDGAADWNLLTQAGSETFGGISYVTCGSLEEADAQAGQEEHSLILLLEEAKKTAQENALSQASNGSQNGYQMHLLLPDNTSLSE